MNLPYFIAKRYFFSRKKKNFINVIAIISMLVVAIGTAALVIVLSVFNGMEDLLRSIYGSFDSELEFKPKEGKSFIITEAFLSEIKNTPGILSITEVIEDNVLVKYNQSQQLVKMKGVSDNFIEQHDLKKHIRQGEFLFQKDGIQYAIIGAGIQYSMAISLKESFYPLQLFYPKHMKPGTIDPSKMYSRDNIMPGGVFALEQQYDDEYIFVPLQFAQNLLNYGDKRTAIELSIKQGFDVKEVQASLLAKFGAEYYIRNSDEQHADLYKVLKIEKLFVFIIFSLIVGIASINIFFSLSMLVIEKKHDNSILYSMGASPKMIRKIFLAEGAIIAFIGAGSGLILGFVLSWLQENYGLVSMGVQTSILDAYPIKIIASDFVFSAVCILIITFLASIQPAMRAAKEKHLKVG